MLVPTGKNRVCALYILPILSATVVQALLHLLENVFYDERPMVKSSSRALSSQHNTQYHITQFRVLWSTVCLFCVVL